MHRKKLGLMAYIVIGAIIFSLFGLKDGASGLLGSIVGFFYFFPGIYIGILVSGFFVDIVGSGDSIAGNIILFLTSVTVNSIILSKILELKSKK